MKILQFGSSVLCFTFTRVLQLVLPSKVNELWLHGCFKIQSTLNEKKKKYLCFSNIHTTLDYLICQIAT